MKMGIRAYKPKMREKKSKPSVRKGKKRGKGEGVGDSKVASHRRAMG